MGILAILTKQFLMRSLFYQTPCFHYQNLIRILNGGQPVRNYNDCFSLCQFFQGFLNLNLIFRVSKGRGFVQDNDWGILEG